MRWIHWTTLLTAAFACSALGLLAGCASTPGADEAMRQRQDQALNDPMGYSPNMDDVDVTGGSIGNYDDKGMKRDLNDLLNP